MRLSILALILVAVVALVIGWRATATHHPRSSHCNGGYCIGGGK